MKGNNVFVGDCEGNLQVFDLRKPSKPMMTKKIHESAVLDICLAGDWIVSTSLDNHIKLWKLESDLVCKADSVQQSTAFCLGYNEFDNLNEVFAGNEEDFVYPVSLQEDQKE